VCGGAKVSADSLKTDDVPEEFQKERKIGEEVGK
jgi:hypothetical protein